MAPPTIGEGQMVGGCHCADLRSVSPPMHLEEPMAGADAAEPEAEATTGLGPDTALAAPSLEQSSNS